MTSMSWRDDLEPIKAHFKTADGGNHVPALALAFPLLADEEIIASAPLHPEGVALLTPTRVISIELPIDAPTGASIPSQTAQPLDQVTVRSLPRDGLVIVGVGQPTVTTFSTAIRVDGMAYAIELGEHRVHLSVDRAHQSRVHEFIAAVLEPARPR